MAVVLSIQEKQFWEQFQKIWKPDLVFVSPTDTVYGLGASALNPKAGKRMAEIKGRNISEFIWLVRDLSEVDEYAQVRKNQSEILERHWPGSITFILDRKPAGSIAMRIPPPGFITKLMENIGSPLLSTSCNLPGKLPVTNINQAKNYFPQLDLYLDGREVEATASTLVDLRTQCVLRKGKVNFSLPQALARVHSPA